MSGLKELQGLNDKALALHLIAGEADVLHDVDGPHRRVPELLLDVSDQHGGDPLHDLLNAQIAVGHPLVKLPSIALATTLTHLLTHLPTYLLAYLLTCQQPFWLGALPWASPSRAYRRGRVRRRNGSLNSAGQGASRWSPRNWRF